MSETTQTYTLDDLNENKDFNVSFDGEEVGLGRCVLRSLRGSALQGKLPFSAMSSKELDNCLDENGIAVDQIVVNRPPYSGKTLEQVYSEMNYSSYISAKFCS